MGCRGLVFVHGTVTRPGRERADIKQRKSCNTQNWIQPCGISALLGDRCRDKMLCAFSWGPCAIRNCSKADSLQSVETLVLKCRMYTDMASSRTFGFLLGMNTVNGLENSNIAFYAILGGSAVASVVALGGVMRHLR